MTVEELLEAVASGAVAPRQAAARLAALEAAADLGFARLDFSRQARCGVPEAVLAQGKSVDQLLEIVARFIERTGAALVTRLDAVQASALEGSWPDGALHPQARVWTYPSAQPPGRAADGDGETDVAVVCAGTSDVTVAEEAVVVVEAAGRSVRRFYDVGVAGLHRIVGVIEEIRRCRVVIVAAGMDGALPTVVAGLVRAPVVAVPTSVGYGSAMGGLAPLLTMLNGCAPGVAVVNIDNGYGAAVLAIKMLALGERPGLSVRQAQGDRAARSSSIASPYEKKR
ncbi:MAG: nickel pincer cofactor biosynthesis protein LarB [Acidobacteria bacterium]|nr:MAG: nickel pincer cofactor biosynthesis protein LarB [Acidobacteriota bacterium]REK10337.1 MAG: nickel pincer cofactor biosynthesis protein LarB [Acidobacteriota bacterium]